MSGQLLFFKGLKKKKNTYTYYKPYKSAKFIW